jgi:putative flippase GtrA
VWKRLERLLRAGLAGMIATGVDLLTLSLLVTVGHWTPRAASPPALILGGIVNFIGNRDYAFRAQAGSMRKQAAGYVAVELVALALNGIAYDTVLRAVPQAGHVFWLVRLATTNLVFLAWSYPLWRKVFRVGSRSRTPTRAPAQRRAPST